MYQNIYYSRRDNIVHLWDDQVGYKRITYNKYAYIKAPNGRFVALDGKKVEKVHHWDDDDVSRGLMYESDVRPEMRVLIDSYNETDDVSTNHRVMFLDIEVETINSFPKIENPVNKITTIGLYLKDLDEHRVFVLDEPGRLIGRENSKGNVHIIPCLSEHELIDFFLEFYQQYQPTIITGWNIDYFDIPYLYERISKVTNRRTASLLSPIEVVEVVKRTGIYNIAGVTCLDYLALFKKFTPNEQPSYALDFIGKQEVGLGKIQFDGSLDKLFETDIDKFIEYNINDNEIVRRIDDKFKYIELSRSICHKGHVPYNAIWAPSRYLEGAILTYMKRLGIVSPNGPDLEELDAIIQIEQDNDEDKDSFSGAYVKPPVPGRYEWLFSIDATSLYPCSIMTLNISPETKICMIDNWDHINSMAKYHGIQNLELTELDVVKGKSSTKMTKEEILTLVQDNNYTIAGNGAVYSTTSKGLIPSILEKWFDERTDYKKLMKKYSDENDYEKVEYFDRLQYVTKIMLNAMYGVLGLRSFRFFDIDNAEAVTTTGRDVLRFADVSANEFMKNKYKLNKDIDICIYSDTDSNYISCADLVKSNPDLDPIEVVKTTANEVANHINKNLKTFSKIHLNSDYNKLIFKGESIIRSAFFVAKKRYAYSKKYDLEVGKVVDKVIVKGIDVVRSNFPKIFREKMNGILTDILNFRPKEEIDAVIFELRSNLKDYSIYDLAKPTSVKKLNEYDTKNLNFKKGTPVHVKAALAYNVMLRDKKLDTKFQPIKSGSKVKWLWLKDNPYHLDTLAFIGYDDPKEIIEYLETYVDYEHNFKSNLEKKVNNFYEALKWGSIPDLNYQEINNFFEF